MKYILIVLFLMCTSVYGEELTQPVPAIDEPLNTDRLWLPNSYVKYWSNLRQIAELQLASERCVEVVRGELLQSESSIDHPIFAIVCRDRARKTYVEKFNGLLIDSYELAIINPPAPPEVESTEDEVVTAETKAPESENEIAQRFYGACKRAWQGDVKFMQGLVWLDSLDLHEPVSKRVREPDLASEAEPAPAEEPDILKTQPQIEETVEYLFERRFNARNAAGVTLRYRAVCTTTGPTNVQTHIDIRRD